MILKRSPTYLSRKNSRSFENVVNNEMDTELDTSIDIATKIFNFKIDF